MLDFHPKVPKYVREAIRRALRTFPIPFRKILDQRGRVFDIKPSRANALQGRTALAETEDFLLRYNPSSIKQIRQRSFEDVGAIMAQELDHMLRSEIGFPGGEYYTGAIQVPEVLRFAVTRRKLDPVTERYIRDNYLRQDWPVEVTGLAAEQAVKKGKSLAKGVKGTRRGKGLLPKHYKEAMKARREQARAINAKTRK